ncbi:MAG: BolA/IbaG family iron-sulfur metabolism protein [Gammaproteobacteria bacterium]|nr:BolA/IbaG family iron-sulfur metabolism protein [Gammaproteobacteria bacterium]MDH5693873.1 BolA/IbaG family iron-sulfur metabolism protein [Gammaproteobacteria bacterium]
MAEESIKYLIEKGIPDSQVMMDGDGCNAAVVVVSSSFEGKSLLEQQRMVYATLGNRIADGTIHALSIKSYTPSQWEASQHHQ